MFRTALRTSVRSFLHSSSTVAPRSLPLTNHHLTAYRYISQDARSKIQSAITANPIVLFMKGTPEEPQCGFSRAVCQILDIHGVPEDKMKTYNVLGDEELRTAIKEFSDWPTVPQIYVNGEFVGGCDILLAMHQSGELEKLLVNNLIIPKVVEDASGSSSSSPQMKE